MLQYSNIPVVLQTKRTSPKRKSPFLMPTTYHSCMILNVKFVNIPKFSLLSRTRACPKWRQPFLWFLIYQSSIAFLLCKVCYILIFHLIYNKEKSLPKNEDDLSCASSSLFFYGQFLCAKLAKIFQYSRCSADQEKREDRLWVSFHLPCDG